MDDQQSKFLGGLPESFIRPPLPVDEPQRLIALKRYDLLERANRLIDVELPIIPLYQLSNQYLFRDHVSGINTGARATTMVKGIRVGKRVD